jgi:hypothetical protein
MGVNFCQKYSFTSHGAIVSGFTISAQTMVFALYMILFQVYTVLTCPDLQSFRNPPRSSRKQYHYQHVAALTHPDLQSSLQATILQLSGHCAPAVSVGYQAHNQDGMPGNHIGIGKMPVDLSAFSSGHVPAGVF